jgi:hypothetical protein
VTNKTTPVEIDHDFDYDPATKVFSSPAGIIQHNTLGIDTLAPSHAVSEYKFWDIAAYTSPPLTEGESPLWLYLKCSKSGTAGTFFFSENAIKMDSDANYYHFLSGHLGSEYQGVRRFVELFGFSEWTPGALRINKVINIDGTQYWDMLNSRFMIGNNDSFLSWNVDRANGLVLKGTIVQSPTGDTDFLGVDRGSYVSGTIYYPGDMVKYTNGNIYKCIQQTTTVPTDTTYWKLVTSKGDKGDTGNKGENGTEGQGYLYAYCFSNSLTPPPKPSTGGVIPNGWMSAPEFNGYRYIYVSQCIKTNGSWGNWSDPSLYAMKPEPGDPGPAIVYRGEFSSSNTYYNNAARRDVVKYGNTYYIYAGTDAAGGSWISANWQEFGSQFSSVATDLLLAVNANVGGFIFKNGRLESVNGKTYLDGESGVIVIESGIFKGSIATPFVWNTYSDGNIIELSDNFNIAVRAAAGETITIRLPVDLGHNGKQCRIYNPPIITSLSRGVQVGIADGGKILGTGEAYSQYKTAISVPDGRIAVFTAISDQGGTGINWVCENYKELI